MSGKRLKIVSCPICGGDAYDIEVELWGMCDACKHEADFYQKYWDEFDPFAREFRIKRGDRKNE